MPAIEAVEIIDPPPLLAHMRNRVFDAEEHRTKQHRESAILLCTYLFLQVRMPREPRARWRLINDAAYVFDAGRGGSAKATPFT